MAKKVIRNKSARSSEERAKVRTLGKETRQLFELCQSRALKMANGYNEEAARLRRKIAENRFQLKKLAISVGACQGAYETVMDAFQTINLADSHLEP